METDLDLPIEEADELLAGLLQLSKSNDDKINNTANRIGKLLRKQVDPDHALIALAAALCVVRANPKPTALSFCMALSKLVKVMLEAETEN
jgi:hypothetical protein